MASINGITAKSVRKFRGHEGELLYGANIYLGSKKIGSWEQDTWSGPDHIVIDEPYSEKRLDTAIAKANPHKALRGISKSETKWEVLYDLSLLMSDLMILQDEEKDFKKATKEGYAGLFIYTDGYHVEQWYLPGKYVTWSDDEIRKRLTVQINEAKKGFFEERPGHEHFFKVYRSLDDFSVGSRISLKEIMV